jgi:hypothetical protein
MGLQSGGGWAVWGLEEGWKEVDGAPTKAFLIIASENLSIPKQLGRGGGGSSQLHQWVFIPVKTCKMYEGQQPICSLEGNVRCLLESVEPWPPAVGAQHHPLPSPCVCKSVLSLHLGVLKIRVVWSLFVKTNRSSCLQVTLHTDLRVSDPGQHLSKYCY